MKKQISHWLEHPTNISFVTCSTKLDPARTVIVGDRYVSGKVRLGCLLNSTTGLVPRACEAFSKRQEEGMSHLPDFPHVLGLQS